MTYDDAGNVTIDSRFRNLSFEYDATNRQKQSANLDGSNAVVSVFDAGGQRVATQVGGALTNVLVYDLSGKLLAEYGSSSSTQGTQYAFDDQQGTPRVITNASGAVVSRHDYAPFGEDIPGNVGMRVGTPGYAQPDGVRQKHAGMAEVSSLRGRALPKKSLHKFAKRTDLIAGGNATGSERQSRATLKGRVANPKMFDPFRVRSHVDDSTVGVAHGYLIQPLRGYQLFGQAPCPPCNTPEPR